MLEMFNQKPPHRFNAMYPVLQMDLGNFHYTCTDTTLESTGIELFITV